METTRSSFFQKNVGTHRYELVIDGHVAFIDYKQKGDVVYLIHTEVPDALQGRGIAAELVELTFKHMEAHKEVLVPRCPYVQSYLKRHTDWERLVKSTE
jgi:predicted GNAT family acetyltransferase